MAEVTLTISAEDSASQVISKVAEGLDKLTKGAEAAGKAHKDLGEKSQGGVRGIQDLGSSIDQLANQFRQLLNPSAIVGTFIGVELVSHLRTAIAETTNYAGELRRLHMVTGASYDDLAELNQATHDLGIGTGSLQRAFFLMSNEINTAGTGLSRLGINIRDGQGTLKNEAQLLFEVSDKLHKMEDATRAMNIARDIFGRGAGDLLPLLRAGSERIKELGADAREFGLHLQEDSVVALKEYEIVVGNVEDAWLGLKVAIIQDALPALHAIAEATKDTVVWFRQLPEWLRKGIEVAAILAVGIIALAGAIKLIGAAIALVTNSALIGWITTASTAIAGLTFPVSATIIAITALGAAIVAAFTIKPEYIIDQFSTALSRIRQKYREFQLRGMTEPAQQFGPPDSLQQFGPPESAKKDIDYLTGELQKQLQVVDKLTQAQLSYSKAIQASSDAQIDASKAQEIAQLRQLAVGIKSGQIQVSDQEASAGKITEIINDLMGKQISADQLIAAIHKAGAAERVRIAAEEVVQRLNLQNQVTQAEIAATMAGEDAAKATFTSAVALARLTYDVSKKKRDDEIKFTTDVEKAEFVYLGASIKLAEAHRDAIVGLASQEASTRLAGLKIIEDVTNAALDDELTARQHDLDNFKITQQQFTEIAIATADKQLESKQRVIAQEAIDTEKNRLAQIENVELAIKDETQKADAIKKINADAYAKLVSLGGDELKAEQENTRKRVQYQYDATKLIEQITTEATGRNITIHVEELEKLRKQYLGNADMLRAIDADLFKDRKTLYDQQVQQAIDAALKETDLYRNEAQKQIAIKAGEIEQIESLQQEAIKKSATVLEDQARKAGDLGAAYQVGFAEAASSADDAFKVIKKSGAEAYQSLKSGISDVVFNFITGASTISDIFVNLGMRILRSFTDVFAEIIAKQALLAAGFSLPGLLGTAGTAIAATAGFEGAPNQAATAVQQLGTSATTASQALGGVGQVSAFLSATFGSLGSLLLTFGSAVLGVGKLLASIGSFGAIGSIGSTASGALGAITSLGSVFRNFTTIIQGGLENAIQGAFNIFGATPGAGGFFGSTGFGQAFIPSIGADLFAKAIPIAGGLISIGLDFLHGNIAGGVGGAIGGGIGAFFGGPIGFGIGEAIGSFIGGLFGGLFGGPTPEISGKVQLNSTNIQALLAATRAVPFSSGPGPNQVNNPPDRSNFSFLDTGPLHSELFKHRTQGTLSREESQLDIQNVILATLQAAVKGLSQLGSRLPTEALSKALSTRIDAVLAKGFDVANFDFEGDVEEVVKNFQDFLKGLSGQTLTALTTELFPSIDLTALGAGDAAKGFDVLASSLAGFSNLLVKSGHATAFAGDSIDQFATRSVDFFTQFTKDGEVLADTITRVSQQIGQMIDQLNAFHVSTDQFLLGLQTQIGVLSIQSGGGLGEFNLLRDVAPGIIGAFSRDVQVQFLGPLIASLKDHALAAIEANAPIGDLLAGRQQVVGFGLGLFQSLQGEADPIKAIQGLQVLAKGAEDLLAGEIEGAKAYYAKQSALAQAAANARIAQLEEEKKTIQLNTSAIEAQITAAEAHISQLEVEKRGIEESTKGLEGQIKALEDLGQARLAPLQEEQRLLQDQLSTLQQQAQAVQAWKGVLDSVTKQLTDLRLSSSNPQNTLERLTIAQQLVTQAKAKFAAEGTPEAATALQQALNDELKIAQEAFQRPSSAYQHIFDQVSADLRQIQSVADTHAVGLEHLTREIAARQARIETLNQQIKEIEQQTQAAVKPLNAQLEALKAVNAVRLQEIAAEEAQIQSSVQPLREQLQAMKADAATRLQAIEAEEAQVRTTLQTTIAGLMSQQDSTIQGFREEATGWLRAIRNEAMVRLEQAVREGNAEIARLLGLPPPLDPRFAQASQGLMSLAQLAQGGGLTDIATSLASSSQSMRQGHLPDALTAMMRSLALAQGTPALQTGIGPEIISRFSSVIRDTQAGLYDPALASLNNLVQLLRNAGLVGAPVPGFASGLEYVPSDNFPARLHRGERVLTAEENRLFSSQGGSIQISFSPTVQVTLHGDSSSAEVRDKLDAAIASLLTGSSRTRQGLVRFAREHR